MAATLAWYRSWPEVVPDDRAYVVDSLPRLLMRDCNYATVTEWPGDTPGFCMLEWDVALASEERRRFAEHALTQPDRILVAPYPIYPVGGGEVCVHRYAPDESRMRLRAPIRSDQFWAHSFGFGCIYLPRSVLEAWWSDPPGVMTRFNRWTDSTFSDWHIAKFGRVTVDWSVHPQHLHGD